MADMALPVGRPRIFGTGLVALDLVISADATRPVQSWAGGTCGNVLSILAYLGWDSFPIARLNHDAAAFRVAADMSRWGVQLDFLHSGPTSSTPIIIQENRLAADGTSRHRFTWSCPRCGNWLPSFRPITRDVIPAVEPLMDHVNVFFFDRLSRAALSLAKKASMSGAVVVFEPSGRSEARLFEEALRVAHIVKYADQRLSDAGGTMSSDTATVLEIQTLGSHGLRFRHKLDTEPSDWMELGAVDAPNVVDTCGSGDWCTAGLLSRLGGRGLAGLTASSLDVVTEALHYGQSLAAWNCAFEGARGGMYADRGPGILETWPVSFGVGHLAPEESGELVSCPACAVTA